MTIFWQGQYFYTFHIGDIYIHMYILASGQSEPQWKLLAMEGANMYVFRILRGSLAKSALLWLCWRSPAPQQFKGQFGACDKLHQHYKQWSRRECCHFIWDHIRCIMSCTKVMIIFACKTIHLVRVTSCAQIQQSLILPLYIYEACKIVSQRIHEKA